MVVDIFLMYEEGAVLEPGQLWFCRAQVLKYVQIYGVTLTAQSDVNINGQGFIQVEMQKLFQLLKPNMYKFQLQASNLNVSARYSELDMRFFQCHMCSNGEVFEDMLHLIGTNIWTETEQLLVDLLQQASILTQHFQTFVPSHSRSVKL